MPLYDFRCKSVGCEHEFEEKVSLTELDTKVVFCPKCGDEAKKVMSVQRTGHTTWKNWRL